MAGRHGKVREYGTTFILTEFGLGDSDHAHVGGQQTLAPDLPQGCAPCEYDSASGSLLVARRGEISWLRFSDGAGRGFSQVIG